VALGSQVLPARALLASFAHSGLTTGLAARAYAQMEGGQTAPACTPMTHMTAWRSTHASTRSARRSGEARNTRQSVIAHRHRAGLLATTPSRPSHDHEYRLIR
jgi:hypothetical protein